METMCPGEEERLPPTVEVAVVGAGPVGLMVAGELSLGGVDVVVLERLVEPTGESRASQLGPRSMELLLQRGLVEALGVPQGEPYGHFGGFPLDVAALGGSMPGNWKVPQFRTEDVLQAWATRSGVSVHRGVEVLGVREEHHCVVLDVGGAERTSTVRARYVVGCDGGDSTVRRLTGFAFPGTSARREMLRADVRGVDIRQRRFERLEKGVVAAATRPDQVTRIMVHEFARPPAWRTEPPGFGEIADAWKRVTGEDISEGTSLWTDAFDDTCRQTTEYRRGRVFLAGDSARVHMPIGGQSLNTGLQDAVNLGWKLAAQVRGRAPEHLLDTYHLERHPVGLRVLANVETQALLLFEGEEAEPARALFRELLSIPAAARNIAAMVSGLDVRYTSGDDPPNKTMGGRITPCGEARDGSMVRLPPGVGTLLVSDSGEHRADLIRASRPWADRIRPLSPWESRALLPTGVRAVLVRPDGHVAWTGASPEPLEDALSRWFGPPSPGGSGGDENTSSHRRGKKGRP